MSSTPLQTAQHILSCIGTLVLQLQSIELGIPAQTPARSFAEAIAELADRIETFLAAQEQRVTVRVIKEGITGRGQWIAPALAQLRSQGRADCVPGPRSAQLWATVKRTDATLGGIALELRNS